jgi:hypothetical protein
MLALMCVAMLCSYRSYSAIADWGHCYGQKLVRALGFTHDTTPWAATFYPWSIFRRSWVNRFDITFWPRSILALQGISTQERSS